jgi:hypothetical protein
MCFNLRRENSLKQLKGYQQVKQEAVMLQVVQSCHGRGGPLAETNNNAAMSTFGDEKWTNRKRASIVLRS